jgi:hypothetical protein
MGAVDSYIWHLFQALEPAGDEETTMTAPDILYPAIFVFTMLLIGLGLTVWEFSRMKDESKDK